MSSRYVKWETGATLHYVKSACADSFARYVKSGLTRERTCGRQALCQVGMRMSQALTRQRIRASVASVRDHVLMRHHHHTRQAHAITRRVTDCAGLHVTSWLMPSLCHESVDMRRACMLGSIARERCRVTIA